MEEEGESKRRKLEDGSASKKKQKKEERKGICYLSRIPPHLKPAKLRHLLEPYGEVLRIYLVPEDPGARKRRKSAGGNTGKNFTEGWVEFSKKSDAKNVAALLNGEPMGGKRRSAYYYDLWNIKYLHKFKWDNLTEEIVYRRAVRDQKLAAEISAAKKERDFYLERVEQSKGMKSMEEKKRKKQEAQGEGQNAGAPVQEQKIKRKFSQKKAVAGDEPTPRLAKEVLAGVFARRTEDTNSEAC